MFSASSNNDEISKSIETKSPSSEVTVFVCISCSLSNESTDLDSSGGTRLHDNLQERATNQSSVRIQPVDCLAVCDQPVTIAFTAAGKWTYVIAGVDVTRDVMTY